MPMTAKELFKVIDIMTDNLMNNVSESNQQDKCISEFRNWISLSYIGGLIESEEYELVRRYGESKIEEEFKELKKWERWQAQ